MKLVLLKNLAINSSLKSFTILSFVRVSWILNFKIIQSWLDNLNILWFNLVSLLVIQNVISRKCAVMNYYYYTTLESCYYKQIGINKQTNSYYVEKHIRNDIIKNATL